MKKYTQITLMERERIYFLHKNGLSLRKIGQQLGRRASTIGREMQRNNCAVIGYNPDRAMKFAKQRKYHNKSKLQKSHELKQYIIARLLEDKWSPEAITGYLKRNDKKFVSHETIYKYIYSTEGLCLKLYRALMYQRPRRQAKCARKKRNIIPEAKHIENRPTNINERAEFGHAEGDLTFFAGSNSKNVISTIERQSRLTKLTINDNKKSYTTVIKLREIAQHMGYESITFDRGREFAGYGLIELAGIKVYFCNPHSPWQKGSVERMHVFLHKYISKKTNIDTITKEKLQWAEDKLNNLPRKCLGYLTPQQFFDRHVMN